MRNFINIITESAVEAEVEEARNPTKLKDKTTTDTLDLNDPTSKGEVSTTRANTSVASTPEMPGKKASAADTRASMKGFGANAGRAAGHMAAFAQSDLARNAEPTAGHTDGVPEPTTIENLPMVINNQLSTDGMNIEPKWHMVRNLPGYMQQGIKALGQMVFAPFTSTPIEKIQVLSTLSNEEVEVKAMMTWIKRNGVRDDEAELEFGEIMPGYSAQTQIWNADGYKFMVVKDFAGYYVYGMEDGRGTKLGGGSADRKLLTQSVEEALESGEPVLHTNNYALYEKGDELVLSHLNSGWTKEFAGADADELRSRISEIKDTAQNDDQCDEAFDELAGELHDENAQF